MAKGVIHRITLVSLTGLGVLALRMVALPAAMRDLVARQCHQMGLAGMEFTVRDCSWRSIELENLRWTGDWSWAAPCGLSQAKSRLRIERLEVRYDRRSLLHREPCEVALEGAELSVPGAFRATLAGRITKHGTGTALDVRITGDRVAGELRLGGSLGDGFIELAVLPGSWTELGRVKLGKSWVLEPMRATFRDDGRPSTVRIGHEGDRVRSSFDLAVTCTDNGRPLQDETCPPATALGVRGDLSLRGDCRLQDGRLVPEVMLAAQDATVTLPRSTTRFEGLTGVLSIDQTHGMHTPPGERLSVRRLTLGKLCLSQGSMSLLVTKDPPALLVEDTEWEMMGARVRSEGLCIDLAARATTGTVFVEGLSLGTVLPLLSGEGVAAEGMLQGELVFGPAPGAPRTFHVQSAAFTAQGGGCWMIDTPSVKTALQNSTRAHQPSSGRRKKEVYADLSAGLLDFEYDVLKLDLIPEAGGLLARITTSGRTRATRVPTRFKQVVVEIPQLDARWPDLLVWWLGRSQEPQRHFSMGNRAGQMVQ